MFMVKQHSCIWFVENLSLSRFRAFWGALLANIWWPSWEENVLKDWVTINEQNKGVMLKGSNHIFPFVYSASQSTSRKLLASPPAHLPTSSPPASLVCLPTTPPSCFCCLCSSSPFRKVELFIEVICSASCGRAFQGYKRLFWSWIILENHFAK